MLLLPSPRGMKFFAIRKNVLFGLEFMVLAGMLATASVLAFWAFRTIQQTSNWVEHTFEVRDTFSELLAALQDAETAHRAYLLTGREYYFQPYQAASDVVTSVVVRLEVLLDDNAGQRHQFARIRPLIYDQLAFGARTMALKRAGEEKKLHAVLLSDRTRMLQTELRDRVESMKQKASGELADRQHASTQDFAFARQVLAMLLIGSGAVLVLVCLLLLRIKKLERFVTICAWSKTIRFEGQWISFEEYLKRRYRVKISHGISDTEFARRMEQLGN
jgi:CHASE3 domain sensor protein